MGLETAHHRTVWLGTIKAVVLGLWAVVKSESGEDYDQQCEYDDQIDLPGSRSLLPIFQRMIGPS